MGQLSIGVICGIIIAILFIVCFCIGVLVWVLQGSRDGKKSKVMVTMSGTTIRNKEGGVSVLEAPWIPTHHVGPAKTYRSNGSRRVSASPSDASDDIPHLDLERGVSPRTSMKRSSYMSAKKLEIPEALAEEESEDDNLSSEKGGTESPSDESGATTPAQAPTPKIYIQDVDVSPASSPGFGRTFDIHNLLQNVKGLPTDPDEKAAIHAV
ncbi:hypothetical protein TWF506_002799 [Arthrobotrys conoides]|uniref:Uncharacterized protein n=1 Tax=Arthrobotrys conoides TaxID=74498 RepID=A0AAN8RQR4_9PEZI